MFLLHQYCCFAFLDIKPNEPHYVPGVMWENSKPADLAQEQREAAFVGHYPGGRIQVNPAIYLLGLPSASSNVISLPPRSQIAARL